MAQRTVLKFDKINRLGLSKAIPYREFFGKMYISPAQMKSRMALAEEIEGLMIYLFAYLQIADEAGIAIAEITQDAKDRLTDIIEKQDKIDPYLENHIGKVIEEVVTTTIKHIFKPKDTDTDSDSNYWLSKDRAMLIAENEANSFKNYSEYRDAATSGRTKKKWLTENDDKVRLTHDLAEGQTVDIDGLFLIGDSLMRFPMDTMYDPDPREIINCRCSCVYE